MPSRRITAVQILLFIYLQIEQIRSQSIGFHPQFNFGFNPYYSPIFGYGLGLPFGAYNLSPSKNPLLLGSISATTPFSDPNGFMSKAHAKAFLKKLATNQLINLSAYPVLSGSIKDKLNALKHPEFALSPYASGYGYGKHYGASTLPNNPYKSVYKDYYDGPILNEIKEHKVGLLKEPLKTASSIIPINVENSNDLPMGGTSTFIHPTNHLSKLKSLGHYLKPIIKTGAILSSLALLAKKGLHSPAKLNPTGMILPDVQP